MANIHRDLGGVTKTTLANFFTLRTCITITVATVVSAGQRIAKIVGCVIRTQ
jgi:hypothetical protein